MPRGGARPGGGRPLGSKQKITTKARQEAMATGLLPHEWLLKVSRGEDIEQKRWKIEYYKSGPKAGTEKSRELFTEVVYADFSTRIDAAKAAAPFYAPKLATQTVSVTNNTDAVAATLKDIAEKLPV